MISNLFSDLFHLIYSDLCSLIVIYSDLMIINND